MINSLFNLSTTLGLLDVGECVLPRNVQRRRGKSTLFFPIQHKIDCKTKGKENRLRERERRRFVLPSVCLFRHHCRCRKCPCPPLSPLLLFLTLYLSFPLLSPCFPSPNRSSPSLIPCTFSLSLL